MAFITFSFLIQIIPPLNPIQSTDEWNRFRHFASQYGIVYGESGLYPFEVKNAAKVRPEDLRALKAFKEDYPNSQRTLLYRGSERFVRDGILCLPCEEFLSALEPNQILAELLGAD